MKRFPLFVSRLPLGVASAALAAFGVLPSAMAASPVLPGTLFVQPSLVVAADTRNDDPNMDPDYLYLQAFTLQSPRYRTADGSNFKKAIKLYDQAIGRRKNFYDAVYNKAVCYYLLKDYDASIKTASQHITLRPDIMQAYVIRARAYVQKKDFTPALTDLNMVEQKRPDLMDYRLRGKIYFGTDNYAKAVPDFEQYIANSKDSAGRLRTEAIPAFLDLGDSYAKLNDENKAVKAYGDYIANYPDPSIPWEYRGDKEYDNLPYALQRRGDATLEMARKANDPNSPNVTIAAADYQKLTELQPDAPEGYIGLGNVALLRQEWDQAVETLTKAVELAPGNDSALAALGEARRQQTMSSIASTAQPGTTTAPDPAAVSSLQKSVGEFSDALAKNPDNAVALRGRGLANANPAIGNYATATEDFTKLLTLLPAGDPRIVETYFNRASAFVNMNPPQYDKAVADFDAVLSIDSTNKQALVGRGDAYAQLGQYDKAVTDYDVVINDASVDEATRLNVRRNRGVSYIKMQPPRIDEAIADFNAYLAVNPTDQSVKDSLFNAQLLKGPEEQLAALTTRIGDEPTNADNYLKRAAVYDKLMRYDAAIADYNKVIQIDPNNKVAYQNLVADLGTKGFNDPANVDAAIVANTKLISLEPTEPAYLLARGDLYNTKKQYTEAASDYKKALGMLPAGDAKRADVQYLVANLYLAAGDRAQAKSEFDTYFTTAGSDHAKYTDALAQRGDLLRSNKDYAGAIADYSKYLTAKPGDVRVLKVRGQSYLDSNNQESALSDFEAAVAAAPNDSESLTLAASIYYNQAAKAATTDPDKAVPLYKKAIANSTKANSADANFAAAYYYKGLSLAEDAEIDNITPAEQKTMRQEAIAALKKFTELAPSDPQVGTVKSLIEKLNKLVAG